MNYFLKHPSLILSILLCLFNTIFSDPLYLNNANPFPVFSTQGRYDYLTRVSRDKIKEFIFHGDSIDNVLNDDKIFHANIMPYAQFASNGTNYLGESSLTMYNNKNLSAISINTTDILQDSIPQGNPQQAAPNANATANLIYSTEMPLGAIPEPFNFFALFYMDPIDPIEPLVYKTGELLQAEYDFNSSQNPDSDALINAQQNTPSPSGISNFNQVSKIVARYLGMHDTPAFLNDNSANTSGSTAAANNLGIAIPSPLMYDYSNYKNNYFGLLQYPPSRDPKKLFGYGYFKNNYQKIGIRGTFEWKISNHFGFKIYTGFSNLDIDQIKILDTTINYQGPSGAMMLARYPDPIYQLQNNNSPQAPQPYIQPNIYQLTDYTTPIMDNTSNALFNNNVYNYSELNNYLPDEFKTAFLQNIQYNMDNLGQLINQNFRPYSAQSFDDTTFELFYRRLIIYNKLIKKTNPDEPNKIEHMPYTLLPTASIHVTCPIAPRVPANKIFGKPLDNNGHWELGANLGIEFDFINNIILGTDVGFSWYNQSDYNNVPVPTNQFNQGIYLYNANLIKIPGFSYTIAAGMQVDEIFDCVNFFSEYRLIRHAEDNFIIKSINNLLPIKYMENTHTTPKEDGNNTLDTIPNGILYLNYDQKPPYPKIVAVDHMKEVSSWMVQLINITVNYKINSDMFLGFAWQQPFLLRNAYNATTLGISFEMYL
jgi:hypothetical protein